MMIRMRAVDMVEDAGYTPVEALDADEAVAILEARSDIALMCTDIQMPGSMDGLRLAHAVHKRWPSIKIIVVSGQLNPPSSDLPPFSRFFGKPLEAVILRCLRRDRQERFASARELNAALTELRA